MAGILINHSRCTQCLQCIEKCPFNALTNEGDKIQVEANCKACKLCLKGCPQQAISFVEATTKINKDDYQDILVFIEQFEGKIHPVSYELIGKAQELAAVINQKVHAIFMGHNLSEQANELMRYGIDKLYVFDDEQYAYFRLDIYKDAFIRLVDKLQPNTILIGATPLGRSLAPRLAAYLKTGLTADCTVLEMRENTDLVQIRPAFGGNIMAKIITTNHRPQMATVRYKVMDSALASTSIKVPIPMPLIKKSSVFKIHEVIQKEMQLNISDAERLVVMGSGVKDDKGRALVVAFAKSINAQLACTRPLVEKGILSYLYQIGLSGRSCKPKLIVTFGVSGAIQFTAGMKGSEVIIAVNNDPEAPIFKLAHIGIIDDLYTVLPKLQALIEGE